MKDLGMTMRLVVAALTAVFLGLFLVAPRAYTQLSSAAVVGTVSDASGAVIPGVSIKVTNTGTGLTRETLTNESGNYRVDLLPPGNYQVKLTVDGKPLTQNFEIKADPRVTTTAADYAKQSELGLKIRDKLSETHNAIIQIRDVRRQVEDLLKRVGSQSKPINDAGTALNKKLTVIEEALYQTKNQSNQDPLNYPIRLNNKLAALGGVVGSAEAAPNAQSYAVYDELVAAIDAELQKLSQVMKTDVPAFNQLVRDQNIPAVVVK